MDQLIDQLKLFYRDFGDYSSQQLRELYQQDVSFTDPVRTCHGIEALDQYFREGLANVSECRFEFHDEWRGEGRALLPWVMYYRHPQLRKGELLELPGVSLITFDTKVRTHRDYYDLGAMVYEQVPWLGTVVRAIKHKMQQ